MRPHRPFLHVTLVPLAFVALMGGLACSGGPSSQGGENQPIAPPQIPIPTSCLATLRTITQGDYVTAENGGGGAVNADQSEAGAWDTFTLTDLNGGKLQDGDAVTLAAPRGQYLSAKDGGGGAITADSSVASDWETFIVHRTVGTGVIDSGDQVSLSTKTLGRFVSAVNGGGGSLVADQTSATAWETFVLTLNATTPPPSTGLRLIAYLPNYSGSYGTWAKAIDFNKMTHLNLAFATATASNGWDMGASDADVKVLVDAAHAHGVKVLASLGGGGGDQSVIAQYRNASNIPPLVNNLDAFVATHNFDGVDIDIEDGANLGANYSSLVDAIVATLRPKGKLVTAAVAQYLQSNMSDATLNSFDFVNVMIYSNYSDTVSAMGYYANTKGLPKSKLVLGAGFFGTDGDWQEYGYAEILRADPSAWDKDQAVVNGKTVNYTGMASMKKLADYSKGFGGIMFWELSLDTTDSHSLYKVIQADF